MFHDVQYYEVKLSRKGKWYTASVTNSRKEALKLRSIKRKQGKKCEVTTTRIKVPWYIGQVQSDSGEPFQLETQCVENIILFRGLIRFNKELPEDWKDDFEGAADFLQFIVDKISSE